jgi:hypothetical protein
MISVNTVYQTVLALANKEQRGYITPQEFNLYADHAQSMVFEQYFYDLNQFKRVPGNSTEYSDMLKNLEEKINIFNRYRRPAGLSSNFIQYQDFSGGIRVFPNPQSSAKLVVSYVRKPVKPNWTYIVVNDKPLYDHSAGDMQDFEIHPSDKTELVVKILQLAGITLKDTSLLQAATAEEVKSINQEKR